MTSIDSARFPSFETASRTGDTRIGAGIPAHHGAWFSTLDKIAYSLVAFMALAPRYGSVGCPRRWRVKHKGGAL